MGSKAYSSCFMHAIVAPMRLPFFQNIFKFRTFLPKFSNILPFFVLFCPFSEKLHACPYFLEQALGECRKIELSDFIFQRSLVFHYFDNVSLFERGTAYFFDQFETGKVGCQYCFQATCNYTSTILQTSSFLSSFAGSSLCVNEPKTARVL